MPKVLVHNFSISLDGFGTGEPQTEDAPFGHAGQRLHQWMFATRFWSEMTGDGQSGETGIDNDFAKRYDEGVGAEIMGRRKFGWQQGPWTDLGAEDEWQGWWGDNPPFHTPVFVLTHHPRPSIEKEGGTIFHFIDATRRKLSPKHARQRASGTSASAAARRSCATSSPRGSSTLPTSCRCRSCLAAVCACGTGSKRWRISTRSRQLLHRRGSPT